MPIIDSSSEGAPGGVATETRDLVIFHLAFGILAAFVFAFPGPPGTKFASLTALYVAGLPVLARVRGYSRVFKMWGFLLPVSILMIFPDWFLAAQLEVLVFPKDGFTHIGPVAGYMAGLWLIPFFLITYAGEQAEIKLGTGYGLAASSLAALVIFGLSELFLWRLGAWYAQDVKMWGHAAIYVLPAEAWLGGAIFWGWRQSQKANLAGRLGLAVFIMLSYLGALALSYLLIEV